MPLAVLGVHDDPPKEDILVIFQQLIYSPPTLA
jgi:hypothetical protein